MDDRRDTRIEAPVASARTMVAAPSIVLVPRVLMLVPDVQTPVRTVLSVGGSSISGVSPPLARAAVVEGAVPSAAPSAVCEAA